MYAFEAAHFDKPLLVAQLHDSSDGFFATTDTVSSIDWPATSATGTPDTFLANQFRSARSPCVFLVSGLDGEPK